MLAHSPSLRGNAGHTGGDHQTKIHFLPKSNGPAQLKSKYCFFLNEKLPKPAVRFPSQPSTGRALPGRYVCSIIVSRGADGSLLCFFSFPATGIPSKESIISASELESERSFACSSDCCYISTGRRSPSCSMEAKSGSCGLGKRGISECMTSVLQTKLSWWTQVRAVEKEFRAAQGEEDVKHMKKLLNVSIFMYLVGIAT